MLWLIAWQRSTDPEPSPASGGSSFFVPAGDQGPQTPFREGVGFKWSGRCPQASLNLARQMVGETGENGIALTGDLTIKSLFETSV
jgi:hypothetical protein